MSEDVLNSDGTLSVAQIVPEIKNHQISHGTALDYFLDYGVDWNFTKKRLLFKKLFSILSKKQKDLVEVSLNKPMSLGYEMTKSPFPKFCLGWIFKYRI